jgi:hypothetical protein
MTRTLFRAGILAVGAALLLAGCGKSTAVSAADPSAAVASGALPVGISLQAETPVCVAAGDSRLCQIGVWYANGTPDAVTIDATSTEFRDGAGTRYTGTAGAITAELPIDAGVKAKVIWSVTMPYGAQPAEVRWAAADGSVAKASLDAAATAAPSPSASASVPSTGATATPTPEPTTATPTPEPTTATPTPKPTKTATPQPKPTTAQPRPSSTATQPGGAIG